MGSKTANTPDTKGRAPPRYAKRLGAQGKRQEDTLIYPDTFRSSRIPQWTRHTGGNQPFNIVRNTWKGTQTLR